jgi:hypothetical protein
MAGPYQHRPHGGRPRTRHPHDVRTQDRESRGVTLYGWRAARLSRATRQPDPRPLCCEAAARIDMLRNPLSVTGVA